MKKTRRLLFTVFSLLCCCSQLRGIQEPLKKQLSPIPLDYEWYNTTYSYWPFESFCTNNGLNCFGAERDWMGTNDGKIHGNVRSIPGMVGTALYLQGNNSSVDFGFLPGTCFNDPMKCETGFTIAFWLKIPNFRGNKIIIQMAKTRNSRGFTVWTRRQTVKKKKINFSVNGQQRMYRSEADWTSKYWTHITIVWSRPLSTLNIYYNCTVVSTVKKPVPSKSHETIETVSMMIGASQSKKKHSMVQMDELAIWNKTIEPEEICRIAGIETVHGGYSPWSNFSECSQTCGNATRTRTRTCTNPKPRNRGEVCSRLGKDHETQYCQNPPCPIDGGFGKWRGFSICTKTCGGGKKLNSRKCNNPKPQYGGRNCTHLGPVFKSQSCNEHPCPIDGGFTEWSDYSKCTKSCGNGTTSIYRNCTNPAPQYGGKNCSGSFIVSYSCNTHKCPIDGRYTQWSSFTDCSKSCGSGIQSRHRNCTNPVPQYKGKDCNVLGLSTETLQCNTHYCPVDGGFTNWSEFSNCSKTCGNGTTFRYRNCTNPSPQYGGQNCSGEDYIIKSCNTHKCPINGGYTNWSNFTECTKSCGNGIQLRHRNCTNPVPMYNGKRCLILGPANETRSCNSHYCPIHGGYTAWSELSNCSKPCGNGTKYRFRNCTNPASQYGGNNCSSLGDDIIVVECNTHECPIHGGFTNWANFTECTRTCGNGTKFRFRNCTNPIPKYSGRNCTGPYKERVFCNSFPCPIDGGYTEWTDFSNCSKPCGNGTKYRTRNCTNPTPQHNGKKCSVLGEDIEVVSCNSHFCPIHGGFTSWSSYSACSKSCGIGEQIRYRNCTNPTPQYGGRNCSLIGEPVQGRVCNTNPCPIHGGYSNWSIFTSCDKPCGNGTKTRIRHCINPKPKHGGLPCRRLGSNKETIRCNEHHCPINGGYTLWSNFSECSKSCGSGSQSRYRTCTNPQPKYKGTSCSHLGPSNETKSCNTHFCPVHGNYSAWTNFTECTKSCGNGTSIRTRNCTSPVPQHGGRTCSHWGPEKEVRQCNVFPCPIDGSYASWTEFTPCDKTCSNGTKSRTRNCTNPSPQFGGKNCSRLGPPVEIVSCFLRHCPIDGKYGNWSAYGLCSKSCNVGNKNRTRWCNSPRPQHGGKDCEGPPLESIACNTHPCPIHGNYTEWSKFSPCSKTCDGGEKIKTRNCTNPAPKFDGRNCSELGPPQLRERCNIQRCPDIVFNITLNLTHEKWSPSLVNPSSEKFLSIKYSIQNNIKNMYPKTGEISKVEVWRIRRGSVLVDVLLKYNNGLYKGITVLQDAIYTERLLGNYRVMPVSLFTEDVPFSAPVNVSGYNTSSTSVMLTWRPVSQAFTNGNITGYRISYTQSRTRIPRDTSSQAKYAVSKQMSYLVTGLNKFTDYDFRVAAINKRGIGLDSQPILIKTDQDKPLKPPPSVSAEKSSSRNVSVQWSAIPHQDIPGYLQGYHIYYSPADNQTAYRTLSVGSFETSAQLAALDKYTMYKIHVSGFTVKGDGPIAETYVRTDEDVPSKPPSQVTAHNTSSTSISVEWKPIPTQFVHGILKGYIISYHVAARSSFNDWKDKKLEGLSTSIEIDGLKKYTEYVVQVSGYTVKGEGRVSKAVNVWTDEDVPDAYPTNFTGVNTSSTELYLEWSPLEDNEWNGRTLGYTIFYIPKRGYKKQDVQVKAHITVATLVKLFKFTWYKIQIAAFTIKGLGPISPEIELRTSEDVPSESAIKVDATFTSHTSLLVKWTSIPPKKVHGILLGFRIQYWVATQLKDEQMVKTGPETHAVELKNLLIYTKYAIRILGFTSAGDGKKSLTTYATTDQYTPGAPPENLQAFNKTSPTKIKVQWQPIKKPYDVHGILLGYTVYYKAVAVSNQSIEEPRSYTEIVIDKPKQISIEIKGLSAFTRYHIYVVAFTIKGNGVPAHVVVAETCNCHRMLHTNWWPSPPYVEQPGSFNHSGIIPLVLEGGVKTCCEDCAEHGQTIVNYTKTPNGKPAMKKGLQEFKENIDDGELSFPVYGFMDQKVYSGSYGFAPLVQSPGVAMIVIGDEEGTAAKMVIRSIILCWPIVFLEIMLLWILSIVIWFVETFNNSRHFPHNMLQGTWEGMWWAFASMTTLGYGDRIPRTPVGRAICIIWILIGVILIACFNSTMTSILTARILDKNIILYGTKIAAIQNSSEYRFGVRKNAIVNPNGKKYSNLEEIYEALTNREVKGILIDAFTAGSRSELFDRSDIRISKLYDYSSAYGVVLGGESKKLQKCFHSYLSEQRSSISQIIQTNTHTIKESGKKLSVKRSNSLFDPKFPTYLKTVIICASILVLAFLIGAKYSCAKKLGWIAKEKSKKYSKPSVHELLLNKKTMRKEMSYIVEVFHRNCQRKTAYLKQKHLREIQHLAKLKKDADYEPVQKGSLTKHSLWTVQCKPKGNVFSTSLFKRNDHTNGQTNGFSFKGFKKPKEKETIV